MSRESLGTPIQTWWLEPREPLVFGGGAPSPALAARNAFWLPPQSTAAGAVRTALVGRTQRVGEDEARALLEVAIAGPWLARRRSGDAAQGPFELWLPMPADLSEAGDAGAGTAQLLRGKLLMPGPGEGVAWPGGAPGLPLLVDVPGRYQDAKTHTPEPPFWPFDQAVQWALGDASATARPKLDARPLAREHRVHVKIMRGPYTAEPEALFSTAGVRFGKGLGLVLEVRDRRARAAGTGAPSRLGGRLLTLGGEGRTARLTVLDGPSYPPFDSYRRRIAHRAEEIAAQGPLGLRLQLVSAGAFGGWEPAWEGELAKKLLAVAMDRFQPVSGWDLQNRRPRAVRRLVAPGAVYILGPFDSPQTVVDLCETWWETPLRGREGPNPTSFLAAPADDGYGRVLPTPCRLPAALSRPQEVMR